MFSEWLLHSQLWWPIGANQIQISLTPNSSRLHQIQIAHTDFKLLTPNSNHSHPIPTAHTKFKSLTPNLNHTHQIQIIYSKLESLTPHSNHLHKIRNTGQWFTYRSDFGTDTLYIIHYYVPICVLYSRSQDS